MPSYPRSVALSAFSVHDRAGERLPVEPLLQSLRIVILGQCEFFGFLCHDQENSSWAHSQSLAAVQIGMAPGLARILPIADFSANMPHFERRAFLPGHAEMIDGPFQ